MWTVFVSRKLAAVTTILMAALLVAVMPASAQQTYVTRFDLYAGYMHFDSPAISLQEDGVNIQGGVRARRWLTLGFDYSNAGGDMALGSSVLLPALQTQLTQLMPALPVYYGIPVPAGYVLTVPIHSRTQTFAAGPQFSYRHFKNITLFLRPNLGAIVENAYPQTVDPIQAFVVQAFKSEHLVPVAGPKHDRVMFYGFGGGMDYNFSKHVSLRFQADLVHDHLFDDLLQNPRNTVRFSFGPAFNFGPNIAKK